MPPPLPSFRRLHPAPPGRLSPKAVQKSVASHEKLTAIQGGRPIEDRLVPQIVTRPLFILWFGRQHNGPALASERN